MNILFKTKPLFAIIALCFLFGFSCKKEPQEFDLSPEIKALWDFKPGTYWIYQDSISGETDSVYVKEYKRFENNYDGRHTFNAKSATTESLRYIITLDSGFSISIIPQIDIIRNPNSEGFEKVMSGSDEDACNIFQFDKAELISSINIPAGMYEDVLYINSNYFTDNQYCNTPTYQYYYTKKNIGILKYKLFNDKVFELIRYNIVQ